MLARRPQAAVLGVLAAALLAAACGSRLDEETRLAAIGAGADGASTATSLVPGGSATATTAPAAGAGTPGLQAVAGTAAPAAGGDGEGRAAAAGGECVPSGASDVGITEAQISLGEIGTISGPVPGLGQTAINGVKAYLEYLNATQRGICGRTVRLLTGDDRLDTGVNRSEHARLSSEVFGFVGGWAVTDDGGAQVLSGTNIPDVGLAISDARIALPNNFSSNPIASGTSGSGPIMRYFQQAYGLRTAAVVWGAQVTARNSALRFVAELESIGIDVVVQREVAITETNYVPVAQEIENAGAEMVMTALEITGISRLAQAFEQVGYLPKVPNYGAQSYGARLIDQAGSAAEGTLIGITHPPVEDAGSGGVIDTFLEWYQRVNPGAEIDFFAFQGWVAATMFSDAILAAGPSPTRDAVLGVLRTYTTYDAHGFVAPINPAEKVGATCFVIVTVEGGQWRRVEPAGGGFHCS